MPDSISALSRKRYPDPSKPTLLRQEVLDLSETLELGTQKKKANPLDALNSWVILSLSYCLMCGFNDIASESG